jgi:GntR family transcriptional regulator, rspAB operon transcriptional repressor
MLVDQMSQGNDIAELQFRAIATNRAPSVADLVFDELYQRVIALELRPGAKLSEVDVARRMGVSRQPVRDAFYRLSKLGFLTIRPQRATTVAPISERAVQQARFIRTAIEAETVQAAALSLDAGQLERLQTLVERQEVAVEAGDKIGFHSLDDEFHRLICEFTDLSFAWTVIKEHKAHMDRVRYLSLSFGARSALDDHKVILAALQAHDPEMAVKAMRVHLSRIGSIIATIRRDGEEYFAKETA